MRYTVFDFAGTGGVALAMFNTDAVSFLRLFFVFTIDTFQSACNLGFIFDEHLSFSDQIYALSKSCYHYIRALRHTAKTIATSVIHSKLDYCNSLYYVLPKYQINCLQHIQTALARTIVQAPTLQHITVILKSLHCLKVSERIKYKIISLTNFSIPLSHHISMTLYLFSLLMVTTHTLHVTSL